MKRYILLVGGAGARLMDALICGASAGVYPAGDIRVLLADPDQRGVQGAAMLQAHLADYACIQQLAYAKGAGFQTALSLVTWPRALPGDASTLADLTSDSEADALLCQALFDPEAEDLDLHEGFHGRRMLGQVAFAGLLHEAANDPQDPLFRLVEDMARDAERGEDVRVVLAGSVCSGTGAAGIPALMHFIRERVPATVHLGAVLLAACTDQQDAAKAQEAIRQYAREGLCETVCVLGLPRSTRPSAPAELARLTDWLAVYCMDVLLHRPTWLDGVFTVRAEDGPLSWSIFGKAADRYRLAYGQLFKAAMAWVYHIGPAVEKRLRKPFFLRDMFGWYGRYYRKIAVPRQDELDCVATLTRLMRVLLLWLGGLCKTLPPDMRFASTMQQARAEARQHYDGMTELVGQLAVMREDYRQQDDYEESQVHRHYSPELTEKEKAQRRIDAVVQEISQREAAQVSLDRRMGGASTMAMLDDAWSQAESERVELLERHAEAVRRIDHAESIATEEEKYRITDARIKLRRMERHQLMLDARVQRIQEDCERARQAEVRFDRPAMNLTTAENAMFQPQMAERLLQQAAITRREVEEMWGTMVLPGETVGLKEALKQLRHGWRDAYAPSVTLMQALMADSMEEVHK